MSLIQTTCITESVLCIVFKIAICLLPRVAKVISRFRASSVKCNDKTNPTILISEFEWLTYKHDRVI